MGPTALLKAADAIGMAPVIRTLVATSYTGTVGRGTQAVAVTYHDALMYRPAASLLSFATR